MQGIGSTYRAMVAVDIEGSAGRGDVALRQGRRTLAEAMRAAAQESDIEWAKCSRTSHGDLFRLIAPPGTAKDRLLYPFIHRLAIHLRAHNHTAGPLGTIRVRAAVHAGEVHIDEGEVIGGPLEHLARLLDAPPLKKALADASPSATVALFVSEHVYDDVVRHGYPGIDPATFQRTAFSVKEAAGTGWLCVPGWSSVPAAARTEFVPAGAEPGSPVPSVRADSVAMGNARVGQMFGRVGTQIGHVVGDVSFGDHHPAPETLHDQLLALHEALLTSHRRGELDEVTYSAADAEFRDAERYVTAEDENGRGKFVVALKKLRGLVDGVADLGSKITALIVAVRGL